MFTTTKLATFCISWKPNFGGINPFISPMSLLTVWWLWKCLWPSNGIGQAVIFSCCGFHLLSTVCLSVCLSIYLSIFFPCQISVVGDWMSTILWHMVWP